MSRPNLEISLLIARQKIIFFIFFFVEIYQNVGYTIPSQNDK